MLFFLKANEICINAHTQYWNTLFIENFRVLKENLEPKFRKKIHEVLWNLKTVYGHSWQKFYSYEIYLIMLNGFVR